MSKQQKPTGVSLPPKLPGMTVLVFTSSKNEYKEMTAMATKVSAEKRIPPL
jgi:hypothetical protein